MENANTTKVKPFTRIKDLPMSPLITKLLCKLLLLHNQSQLLSMVDQPPSKAIREELSVSYVELH